jgi:hypothetical protein
LRALGGTVLAGGALVGIELAGTMLIGIEVVGTVLIGIEAVSCGFGGQALLVLDAVGKDGGWIGGDGPTKFCWPSFLHDVNHDEVLADDPGGNGTEAEDPEGNGTEAEDPGDNWPKLRPWAATGPTLERASHCWSLERRWWR